MKHTIVIPHLSFTVVDTTVLHQNIEMLSVTLAGLHVDPEQNKIFYLICVGGVPQTFELEDQPVTLFGIKPTKIEDCLFLSLAHTTYIYDLSNHVMIDDSLTGSEADAFDVKVLNDPIIVITTGTTRTITYDTKNKRLV